jgi:hypothetical protein
MNELNSIFNLINLVLTIYKFIWQESGADEMSAILVLISMAQALLDCYRGSNLNLIPFEPFQRQIC